ncbi:18206_t:CDS:2, partial [Gigaspora margarita]
IAVSQKMGVIRVKQLAQTNEIKDAYPNIGDFRFSNTLGEDLENVNEESIGELNVNDISGEEYEEAEGN